MNVDFTALYESWVRRGRETASVPPHELLAVYRDSWRTGDADDRYHIVSFVYEFRIEEGFGLIVEGIGDADFGVARHSALAAIALLEQGYDLGEGIHPELSRFSRQFHQADVIDWAVHDASRAMKSRQSDETD